MGLQADLHLQVGKELLPSAMCSKNILPQKCPQVGTGGGARVPLLAAFSQRLSQ